MPYNKSTKIDDQQNKASIKEEIITLHPEKTAKYPPSLNQIPKKDS
ncbi:hypothetical protein [Paenibacillus pini]|nr:hypothetical protein [Paenibacillus pini]